MSDIKLNPNIIDKEFPADDDGTKFKFVGEDDEYVYMVLIKDGIEGDKIPMSKNCIYQHAKFFGATL